MGSWDHPHGGMNRALRPCFCSSPSRHSLVAPARPCIAALQPCMSSSPSSPPLLAGALKSKPFMRVAKLIELLLFQISLRERFCEEAYLVSEPEQLACHRGLF